MIPSNDESFLTMGDRAWSDESTATTTALLIKHHDNLSIGWNGFIGKNLRGSSTTSTIAIGVRKGRSEFAVVKLEVLFTSKQYYIGTTYRSKTPDPWPP
jgi:hypothetical protein